MDEYKYKMFFFGAALCVLVGLGIYGYQVTMDSMVVHPEKVLKQVFGLNPSEVSELVGGGSNSGLYQQWIAFRSEKTPQLVDSAGFMVDDKQPDVVRRWFATSLLPDDKALQPGAKLSLLGRGVQTGDDKIKNEWFLSNPEYHKYFYRCWGQ